MKNTKNNKKSKNLIKSAVVFSTALSASYFVNVNHNNVVYAETHYSTVDFLNLRQGPGLNEKILTVIPEKENVQVLEFTNNEWVKIDWKGNMGYVSSRFIKKTETEVTQITNTSEKVSLRSDGYYMYANSYVNLRTEANTSSSILKVLNPGDDLMLINKIGDFYHVRFGSDYGYVACSYLSDYSVKPVNTVQNPVITKPEPIKVTPSTSVSIKMLTTDYLNFRDSASTNGNIISVFDPNTEVLVVDNSSSFYKIVFNGTTGYVSKDYLKELPINNPKPAPPPTPIVTKPEPVKVPPVVSTSSKMLTTDYLNFRDSASTNGNIISVLNPDTEVTVIENSSVFYKVIFDGITGYVSSNYLKDTSAPTPTAPVVTKPAPTTTPTPTPAPVIKEAEYMLTNDYLNLRSKDNTNSTILTTVYSGEKVKILSRNTNGWYKVEYNGMTGYMFAKYLSSIPSQKDTSNPVVAVKTATLLEDTYLKAGPNNDFKNLGYLVKGTKVTVLDDSGYFVKVFFADKTGYILDKYLNMSQNIITPPSVTNPAPTPTVEKVIKNMLTTDYLNFRSGAGTSYSVISVIDPGVSVEILSDSNGWSKIRYQSTVGYVSSSYLKEVGTVSTTPTTNTNPINSSTSFNDYKLGKVTTIYDGSVQLTGTETITSEISFIGLQTNYNNVSIYTSASTSISSISKVYVYVNNFLQGQASFNGSSYSYTIPKNITKPGRNEIAYKVVRTNGEVYISKAYINVEKKPLVVIDPGHGGPEPGAVGYDSNGTLYKESTYTFKISKYLKSKLESYGFDVIMTRDGDYDLELIDRANVANRNDADFFISVHHNAALSKTAKGAWTGYPGYKYNPISQGSYTESALISKLLQDAYANVGLQSADPTRDQDYTGYTYSVNRNSSMRSVLTEIGFITNESDLSKITDDGFQRGVASEIAGALYKFFYSKN